KEIAELLESTDPLPKADPRYKRLPEAHFLPTLSAIGAGWPGMPSSLCCPGGGVRLGSQAPSSSRQQAALLHWSPSASIGETDAMRSQLYPHGCPAPRSAFAGCRFPPEVITLAVRWYLRFGLSYRDVEELLAERGVEVDHMSIYRWVQRFAPEFAEAARARQ